MFLSFFVFAVTHVASTQYILAVGKSRNRLAKLTKRRLESFPGVFVFLGSGGPIRALGYVHPGSCLPLVIVARRIKASTRAPQLYAAKDVESLMVGRCGQYSNFLRPDLPWPRRAGSQGPSRWCQSVASPDPLHSTSIELADFPVSRNKPACFTGAALLYRTGLSTFSNTPSATRRCNHTRAWVWDT